MDDNLQLESRLRELIFKYLFFDIYDIKKLYDQSHRYYHKWSHILNLLSIYLKEEQKDGRYTDDEILLSILFHDIVYDPKVSDNEEKSCQLFDSCYKFNDQKIKDTVKYLIMTTKDHKEDNPLSLIDMSIIYSDLKSQLEWEEGIRKEYAFIDYSIYKEERIKFLKSINKNSCLNNLITIVENYRPIIGIYPGSFFPFHIGHKNIFEQAQRMFNKVVVAYGQNQNKPMVHRIVPKYLNYIQVDSYEGSIINYLNSKKYDYVLIRGIRNEEDYKNELPFMNIVKRYIPNLRYCFIHCDKEYEYISSTSIRQLNALGHNIKEFTVE